MRGAEGGAGEAGWVLVGYDCGGWGIGEMGGEGRGEKGRRGMWG